MSRRYDEHVDVRVGEPLLGTLPRTPDGIEAEAVPTAFVWRGRLHVVRVVLGHWTQRRPWWRLAWADDAEEAPVPDLEQHVWRVEASAGRSLETGVYELSKDERWRLVRVAD